jgi:membrane associated rhomboid family serine protease
MNQVGKFIGIYFQQINEFNRRMKSKGYELPFQSLFPFFFLCGIIGGLGGIYIGLSENDYGVLFSALSVTILTVAGPFCLNKEINLKSGLKKKRK